MSRANGRATIEFAPVLRARLRFRSLDLDVHYRRFLWPGFLQRRSLGDCPRLVDRLQIFADGFRRRLRGLVDEELNSCL